MGPRCRKTRGRSRHQQSRRCCKDIKLSHDRDSRLLRYRFTAPQTIHPETFLVLRARSIPCLNSSKRLNAHPKSKQCEDFTNDRNENDQEKI
jgi:hypothetical protein